MTGLRELLGTALLRKSLETGSKPGVVALNYWVSVFCKDHIRETSNSSAISLRKKQPWRLSVLAFGQWVVNSTACFLQSRSCALPAARSVKAPRIICMCSLPSCRNSVAFSFSALGLPQPFFSCHHPTQDFSHDGRKKILKVLSVVLKKGTSFKHFWLLKPTMTFPAAWYYYFIHCPRAHTFEDVQYLTNRYCWTHWFMTLWPCYNRVVPKLLDLKTSYLPLLKLIWHIFKETFIASLQCSHWSIWRHRICYPV